MSSIHDISHDPNCLNAHRSKTTGHPFQRSFVACPCDFCETKDRTLYVGSFQPGELSSPESEKKIFDAFADFGSIQDLTITHARTSVFVRFSRSNSALRAKSQLHGKIFDFCGGSINVNHAVGSQYYRPIPFHRQTRRNSSTMNGLGIQGDARPLQMAAKNDTRVFPGQENALLPDQSVTVPGVNDVLSHMQHSSSAGKNSQYGTVMPQSTTSSIQDDITQLASKDNEDAATCLDTNGEADKPAGDVRHSTISGKLGEALTDDGKSVSEDNNAGDDKKVGGDKEADNASDPDVGHSAIMDEQEGHIASQPSSRTITPTPTPRDQKNSASGQSSNAPDDRSFNTKDITLDYGTVRRYPNKRVGNRQPIPMDWVAPPSSSPSEAHQATHHATLHTDVSPSRTHNSTLVSRGASPQDITPQSTSHGNKSKKVKSKAKKNQQKSSEQSSSYMLPVTAYQPTNETVSEQLPSQS
ncbi:hypothetical protein PG993_014454 [Apiospora rasikravindrae]|uniref:RRM domain-containing protein n=1 Tax=Apiospora rasikravindrae TaxID=990691 RepID=A0ABR1RP71_9PEZI